ncbi:MAG: HAD-IB family hydrolase [Nevskiaceae bacterium]|nr:MAG: HAD-IB family hydrolase [Nevskiaceae bacterium]TBR71879.1 MAG: HAD-IB family hydrolase [Nevskiaceae bacterium]
MPRIDASLQARLHAIHDAPQGAQIAACFDLDGTLIDGFSAIAYLRNRIRHRQLGLRELSELLTFSLSHGGSDTDFHEIMEGSARRCRGMTEEALAKTWQGLFNKELARTLYPEACALVRAHLQRGHTVVIATSATRYQALPFARELGIEHILCSELEVHDGVLTGELANIPPWAAGKAEIVKRFARGHAIDLATSYAYSNGGEDVAFLETVGHPMTLNADRRLAAVARARSWPQARFTPRKHVPLVDKLRTAASYGAMASAFVGGLAWYVGGGKRQQAVNLIAGTATDFGLAAAHIELHILGEENLWAWRPAVFIINHQSQLDFVIGMNLMRRDATGVAKKEAAHVPGFGQFMQFAGMAFVDRHNTRAAINALAPAVAKLKAGLSLGIAPEGTRSYSGRLGPFKKGAFHIAMQAGVPIVPIVIRNAWEHMHRSSQWMRPGVVDIAVLPGIDVSSWKVRDLDRHIAAVRQRYIDLLDDWPDDEAALRAVTA